MPEPTDDAPGGDDPGAGGTSVAGRLQGLVDDVRARAVAVVDDAETRWPQLTLARDLWDRYVEMNAVALAGYTAFRIFLWLMPLTLVLLAAAGIAADQGVDVAQTSSEDLGLGRSLAATIRDGVDQTQSSRWQLAWVAVSGLLLATSGLLKALHLVHAAAWRIPERRVSRRVGLMGRILAAAPMIVLLLLGSSALRKAGLLGGIVGTGASTVIACAILLGLVIILPRRTDELRWLVVGPAVGAVLSIGLHAFATYYLPGKISTMSQTYGAVGIVVALMVYLLLLGQILVLSPLISATVYERWGRWSTADPAPGRPAPPGEAAA